jgi:hypothetical protein
MLRIVSSRVRRQVVEHEVPVLLGHAPMQGHQHAESAAAHVLDLRKIEAQLSGAHFIGERLQFFAACLKAVLAQGVLGQQYDGQTVGRMREDDIGSLSHGVHGGYAARRGIHNRQQIR